jgi:uncharacterized protein
VKLSAVGATVSLYNYQKVITVEACAMRFEWDEVKNIANQRKHGIDFTMAATVFKDPLHFTLFDRIELGEVRFKTFGEAEGFALVVVIHSDRDQDGEEIVRIISARTMTKPERRFYEDENG